MEGLLATSDNRLTRKDFLLFQWTFFMIFIDGMFQLLFSLVLQNIFHIAETEVFLNEHLCLSLLLLLLDLVEFFMISVRVRN